jgi:hypothetical protein
LSWVGWNISSTIWVIRNTATNLPTHHHHIFISYILLSNILSVRSVSRWRLKGEKREERGKKEDRIEKNSYYRAREKLDQYDCLSRFGYKIFFLIADFKLWESCVSLSNSPWPVWDQCPWTFNSLGKDLIATKAIPDAVTSSWSRLEILVCYHLRAYQLKRNDFYFASLIYRLRKRNIGLNRKRLNFIR